MRGGGGVIDLTADSDDEERGQGQGQGRAVAGWRTTPAQRAALHALLAPHPADATTTLFEVAGEGVVRVRDLHRMLDPHGWFTDEAVNTFLRVVGRGADAAAADAAVLSSLNFESVRAGNPGVDRWFRKGGVATKRLLLAVVHTPQHWVLAVADLRQRTVTVLDGFHGAHVADAATLAAWLDRMSASASANASASSSSSSSTSASASASSSSSSSAGSSGWHLRPPPPTLPQQTNSWDCGPIACMTGAHVLRHGGAAPTEAEFKEADMVAARYHIAQTLWEHRVGA